MPSLPPGSTTSVRTRSKGSLRSASSAASKSSASRTSWRGENTSPSAVRALRSSSTIRRRAIGPPPRRPGRRPATPGPRTIGRWTTNRAPPPGRSSSSISPPWSWTARRASGSPRPVPPRLRVKKSSKIRGRSSVGMPGTVVVHDDDRAVRVVPRGDPDVARRAGPPRSRCARGCGARGRSARDRARAGARCPGGGASETSAIARRRREPLDHARRRPRRGAPALGRGDPPAAHLEQVRDEVVHPTHLRDHRVGLREQVGPRRSCGSSRRSRRSWRLSDSGVQRVADLVRDARAQVLDGVAAHAAGCGGPRRARAR